MLPDYFERNVGR